MNKIDKDLHDILTGGAKKSKSSSKKNKEKKEKKNKKELSRDKRREELSPREVKSTEYEIIKKRKVQPNPEYIDVSQERKVLDKNTYEPYNEATRNFLKKSKVDKALDELENEESRQIA